MRRAQRERAGAVRAAGRGAALGAGHRRQVARAAAPAPAPARRPAAPPGRPARPGWAAGRSRRAGSRASCGSSPVGAIAGVRAAQRRPGRPRSPCAQPVSSSSCASAVRANPPTSAAAAGQLGPGEQHLAGVRVRRPRLGVQVVAVVPDHHQPEVGDRREHRRPGADHHRHLAAAGGEERAGTARPARAPRDSATCRPGPSTAVERGVEPVEVAGVGHDRRRRPAGRATVAAAASAIRAGQSSPGSADQTARRGPPVGERAQERRAAPGRPPQPGPSCGQLIRRRPVRRSAGAGAEPARPGRAGAARRGAARRRGCRRTGRPPPGPAAPPRA